MVIFVWKFPNFCYHGNRGWSDTNFTCTVKSAGPENPYLVQESWWYLLYKLSNGRYSDEICQFLLPWQQRWSNKNLNDSISLIGVPPKPPVRCKNLGPILNASWVWWLLSVNGECCKCYQPCHSRFNFICINICHCICTVLFLNK